MNPNIQNSTPTPSPNQPFRIAKDTLFFSIIAIGIFICALKYILFPKVDFSDIWVATTLLLLGMLGSLIGLIEAWGAAGTMGKRNRIRILCLIALLVFGFSAYSEFDKAHDSQELTNNITNIKETGEVTKGLAEQNKENYDSIINPSLEKALNKLKEVDSLADESLAKNMQIDGTIKSNQKRTDSIATERQIMSLVRATYKIENPYYNLFHFHLKRSSEDVKEIEEWRLRSLAIVERFINDLESQLDNPYLYNNTVLYVPWKTLIDSMNSIHLPLSGYASPSDQLALEELANRMSDNYDKLADVVNGYFFNFKTIRRGDNTLRIRRIKNNTFVNVNANDIIKSNKNVD